MKAEQQPTRRINTAALRTLHDLKRTLHRHIDEPMKVSCEDAEAAEALVFAIEANEKALDKVAETRRRVLDGQ